MSNSTTQFITQMKLRELRRQRVQFREAYEQLSAEVAGAGDPGDRLRRLYDGLRRLKFAGQPLHPEVVNLEILLYEIGAGSVSPEIVSLWERRLEEELAAGRLRSEFVYLFGALLEEWAREAPSDNRLREEGRRERERLLQEALTGPSQHSHQEIIDPLFEGLGEALDELVQGLQKAVEEQLRERVEDFALEAVLERLSRNIYQPPRIRREARRFAGNAALRKELADALTILLAELDTWDWPAEGLSTRALWTRNKWRLYLDEDLPTACLLEIIGERWIMILDHVIGDPTAGRTVANRLKKLIDIKAPESIIEVERQRLRQFRQSISLGYYEERDIWEPAETGSAPEEAESNSVIEKRALELRSLRTFWQSSGYGDDYSSLDRAVLLVNAEIQLARAAFPDRPVFVLKTDLQDYYASIPHDVLLTILERLGVSETDREFFRRFLTSPLRVDGQLPTRMQRGVPMAHALSGMLAELLMRFLDRYIQQHAQVRVVRVVDDLFILAPDGQAVVTAWERIHEFCAACGLAVNTAKSGAVCLGGTLPSELPQERPRWGMLELDDQGQWHVHRETFQAHLEQTRERVAAAASTFTRVQLYNTNVKYLNSSLALGAGLGDTHREGTTQAVREFHDAFFGPDQGIVAGLCESIRERFLSGEGEPTPIPESWIYWPITAGGLGLRNPVAIAGQYAESYQKRKVAVPRNRSAGWNTHRNEWNTYYEQLLTAVEPVEPQQTKVMKTLVDDFIARGGEISSGQQQGLAPYWRWILYTYGPEILQRFGTFRFLITELVPLQLISGQLLQDTSLDGGERAAAEPDAGEEDM
jgi:reverse transcriptase-like protein